MIQDEAKNQKNDKKKIRDYSKKSVNRFDSMRLTKALGDGILLTHNCNPFDGQRFLLLYNYNPN